MSLRMLQKLTAIAAIAFVVATTCRNAAAQDRSFGAAESVAPGAAERLTRNFGAVQEPERFRNQNGDFSYLLLSQTYYGGFGYPAYFGLWGGYGGFYGGLGWPGFYGARYAYPFRYYPYAFGYGYGWPGYGPNLYYGGWPWYAGYPWRTSPFAPWYTSFYGGPADYGPGVFYRYAGCYYW